MTMRPITRTTLAWGWCVAATVMLSSVSHAADSATWIKRILDIKNEASGSAEAAVAWKELVGQGPEAIPALLQALNQANPIAANYIHTIVDAISENARTAKKDLPEAELMAFLKETKNLPAARRLAFELIVDRKPDLKETLLAGMLNDRSNELRRDAIEQALRKLEKKPAEETKADLEKLFEVARDLDQVQAIAKKLEPMGVKKNLTEHFNFITSWWLIAPFDNVQGAGFAKPYAPEEKVDLDAKPIGKEGKPVEWVQKSTSDAFGSVDLNKELGKFKGAVAYAFAAVESPTEQPVELRVGSINAVVIFLNGKQIYAREEYHHGEEMDQYIGRGVLKPGRNEILIKVCQNEQTQSWAQRWQFQLRISDETGGKVPFKLLPR
ncbi:ATP phosphoribosyltransferase regulatory subunit [Tuwongella immobilis]|uniref:HEAT repeat domain-containing protein n=1 Tax=Tuwongella immobilis TaxID=692036 RepID=A0A6C2YNT9_9BACT|nr:ATP phosphoribosyltransferase regulatory subunit [Tuwongella immobilis]VIP03288.1 Uncharacterized protein OS=Chthoniobacter flavus Ellin428 GN=CfE428DRAFT_1596 PE=4 SV=1 [Tuwongella immobilis]VTS03948.1 Uncharacterized protein OS=Chthoniobacter flavus Ellin428 GN=CfE428DRAFT_1596 PE=4 SV=1 [Tuwongella immobilis]